MTPEWREPSDFIPTGSIRSDSSWPGFARDEDRFELLHYLEERFGIVTSTFDSYHMLQTGKSWWMIRKSAHLEIARRFKVFGCGIKAFERVGRFVKPTTRLMQLFGGKATASIVDLMPGDLQSLVKGEGIACSMQVENGYVLLRINGKYNLGLGLLIRGIVRSQIRKGDLQQIFLDSPL